ncbi:unnamed protein product [Moneuplotes crassus]|uniref:CSC1/OSCA1-like cytosolic domain-containing protein n=1 Tax=Euplotes crassus TaxID=5936 RepID=A0AAD1XCH0_EUPCR|nr:unnamed protein product [Moneuplotes crassus]
MDYLIPPKKIKNGENSGVEFDRIDVPKAKGNDRKEFKDSRMSTNDRRFSLQVPTLREDNNEPEHGEHKITISNAPSEESISSKRKQVNIPLNKHQQQKAYDSETSNRNLLAPPKNQFTGYQKADIQKKETLPTTPHEETEEDGIYNRNDTSTGHLNTQFAFYEDEDEKNLDRCPPNFRRSVTLGQQMSVPKELSLCCDMKQLAILGSGFPLYYHFKTFSIIMYFLMVVVVGLPSLWINLRQKRRDEWSDSSSYIISTSIGNHGNDPDEYTSFEVQIQLVQNLAFIFVIIFGSIFLRSSQNQIINEIDEMNITPADFGVMISNIPKDKKEEDLKDWIQLQLDKQVEIVYVSYCYDITQLVKITRKITKLQQAKAYVSSYRDMVLKENRMKKNNSFHQREKLSKPTLKILCCIRKSYPAIEKIDEQIKVQVEKQNKVQESMKKMNKSEYFCSKAFVVFSKQSHAEAIINHFETSLISRIFSFIIYKIFKRQNSQISKRYWEGKLIYAERASEPGDIFWDNLGVTIRNRLKRVLWTFLIAIICLGIAFGINFGIRQIKKKIENQDRETILEQYLIRSLSIFVSFLVAIINTILGRIVRILTSYEKHETYTKYHLSVAFKLTIAMFINTGINPLLVNYGTDNWFDSTGLMVDIFYIALTISFVGPFTYLLDPSYLIRLCKRWRELKKGDKSKLTQRQANILFEGPPLDMAQRYSNTMLLFCMAVFYVFPLPIISFICLFGAIFQYWLEKYLLLKRHKIPEQIGETMAQIFSNMIPFFCLLYGISLFCFSNALSGGKGWVGMAAFTITLLNIILPFRQLLDYLKRDVERNDNPNYKEECLAFHTDYDRANPISATTAQKKHQKRVEFDNYDLFEDDSKKKESEESENSIEGVITYGRQATTLEGKVFKQYKPIEMNILGSFRKPKLVRSNTQNSITFSGMVRKQKEIEDEKEQSKQNSIRFESLSFTKAMPKRGQTSLPPIGRINNGLNMTDGNIMSPNKELPVIDSDSQEYDSEEDQ